MRTNAGYTKKDIASRHRSGRGWIVVSYSPRYDAWINSPEMDYWHAVDAVREAREMWNTAKQDYDEL
jgi:hypothetical protein